MRHYDMYFMDGGTPSEAIVRRFCEVAWTVVTLSDDLNDDRFVRRNQE